MRLSIRTAHWRAHVAQVAASTPGLVPVVKGNGYGFGREWLAEVAAEFADTIAVGTIHELEGLPASVTPVVLTPTLVPPTIARQTGTEPVLTIGNDSHLAALAGWDGRVVVKLASGMQRFGGTTALVDAARAAGLDVVGVSIHPPLAGTGADHAAEITRWLPSVDPSLPVWVSHLDAPAYASLPATHTYRNRLGTWLWHGDKSALHLSAEVLERRAVAGGRARGLSPRRGARRRSPRDDRRRQRPRCRARSPTAGARSTSIGPACTCTKRPTCTSRCASSRPDRPARRSATASTCNGR